MMKLSVVIVNYNVKYFLEQCLISVYQAVNNLLLWNSNCQTEVFVVDNNSVDSSTTMIKEKFPQVHLIQNTYNAGFSAANNMALKLASGQYCLLLNPDTVVEEDTLIKIVNFMDLHQEAGGLGVKMIDGKGNFLPESKRSLPTPEVAFYKIFGLSKLFPHSKKFGKYHLGYLNENQTHEVEVLSGAFFLIRKKVLDDIGLLDETFFMYGEDIDLSYRINQAGYKNYYFSDTRIIHYKGESTKKSSVNYVLTFYKAMVIFANKHFSVSYAKVFSLLIHTAIYSRAFIAILHRFFKAVFLPVIDLILIFFAINGMRIIWENYAHGANYPHQLVFTLLPLYSLIWVISLSLYKNYNKPFSLYRITKGILLGIVVISIIYAFLEENMRFSRALLLLGTISSWITAYLTRLSMVVFENKSLRLNFRKDLKIAIIGDEVECTRILELLKKSNLRFNFSGFISPENYRNKSGHYIGDLSNINEIVEIHKINELIFSAEDLTSSLIIKTMSGLDNRKVIFKIAPSKSIFIIGSNHKNQSGDLYTIDIQLAILSPENRFNKRLFDIVTSVLFLALSPLLIWFYRNKNAYFKNTLMVISGKLSWVGYNTMADTSNLPAIKSSVTYYSIDNGSEIDPSETNMIYVKDYSVWKDLISVLKLFR